MHDSIINQTPLFSPHRLRNLFLCQVEVPFKLIHDPLVRNGGPNGAFRCLVIGRTRFQLRLVCGIEQDRSYRVDESFEETHYCAHSTSTTIRNGGRLWNWEIWESHWACMRVQWSDKWKLDSIDETRKRSIPQCLRLENGNGVIWIFVLSTSTETPRVPWVRKTVGFLVTTFDSQVNQKISFGW